jgi:hypothetical protein
MLSRNFTQRWFYLDVLACGVFAASQNVPEAPARARQCRPTGRRAQGIFGAEWPSTRPNGVVARAAGKTCWILILSYCGTAFASSFPKCSYNSDSAIAIFTLKLGPSVGIVLLITTLNNTWPVLTEMPLIDMPTVPVLFPGKKPCPAISPYTTMSLDSSFPTFPASASVAPVWSNACSFKRAWTFVLSITTNPAFNSAISNLSACRPSNARFASG